MKTLTEKICRDCGELKAIEDYYFVSGYYRTICKECVCRPKRAEMKTCICATCNEMYESIRSNSRYCSQKCRLKADQMYRYYRMSMATFNERLESQGYKCICGIELNWRTAVVDHNHKCCPNKNTCGKCVRGLLCHRCNKGLGWSNDDPQILNLWVDYLQKGSN